MLKNPATGKKVKITGKIGQKLVKDFLEGRITLDKKDVKMIREGEKVAKQALKAQKKIETGKHLL